MEVLLIGAYPCLPSITCALMEGLDHYTNVDIMYHKGVHPLREITERGRKGGIKRLIAREQFREAIAESDYYITGEYEDFEDPYTCFDTLVDEEMYWIIHFDAGDVDFEEVEDAGDIIDQLQSDEECRLIVYEEAQIGFFYVLKSDFLDHGRLNTMDQGLGVHVFDEVVVFDDDHPDYQDTLGNAFPPDVVEDIERYVAEGWDSD